MNSHPIVITGIGPVSSAGVGKKALWHNVMTKSQNVTSICQKVGDEIWAEYPLSEVGPLDEEDSGLRDPWVRSLTGQENNRDLLLFATAVRLGLLDAGICDDDVGFSKGIVMAHENPGSDEYTRQIWKTLAESPTAGPQTPLDYVRHTYEAVQGAGYGTHSFVLLQQLTRIFGIHGPALTLNNACASGLFALETAASWIRSGHVDMMVVVCGDSPRLITRYLWLAKANACTTENVMRPFARNRSGFILGEGVGAVVIETRQHAIERRARIYCEYLGGSFVSDAWKLNLPCVTPNYYQKAIQDVLETTGLAASEIDLVIPHGAASSLQDRYEAEAIATVFGSSAVRPAITALKPYIGHTLAGSAVLELIIGVLAAENGTIPATLNLTEPDPQIKIRLVTEHCKRAIKNWLKTTTGFGGFSAACVFRQQEKFE
jgi:3-oxoacyl-(acyl-carrier-protein) synthase